MRVRLGYVAIALNLPKVTSSSAVTFANYNKIFNEEEKLRKLKKVTLSNLEDLMKILQYNVENDIHFYRITSTLVPLGTHPEVMWNYRNIFKRDFQYLGDFIKRNDLRVDTHPNEFNVINSIREDVVESTIRNLWAHVHLFEDMGYENGKMVLHVGSSQGGRESAMDRFIRNFKALPKEISERVILENDDKTFTAKEVLHICKEINAPMVFDVHHHLCNNQGEAVETFLEDIFHTWDNEFYPPKLHFSSPKDGGVDRKHHDYMNCEDFIAFIDLCKDINMDIDIMIEAKGKDQAMFKLIEELKENANYKWIDRTSFEI